MSDGAQAVNKNYADMTSTSDRSPLSATASAPGKLILFGEHAVVHGQPAIAAALSDSRISVTATLCNDGVVQIHMPDIDVSFHATGDSVSLHIQAPPTIIDSERIKGALTQHSSSFPSEFSITALSPVIYLLNLLVPSTLQKTRGISVYVRSSNLPAGAGLGSSAAFGVACSSALYKLKLLLDPSSTSLALRHRDDGGCIIDGEKWVLPSDEHLKAINILSYYSEILIHGTPSGIDNAVSTYGGAIYFQKNLSDAAVTMEKITIPTLNIILTNTNIPRFTKALVAGVCALNHQLPSVVDGILKAIGAIST